MTIVREDAEGLFVRAGGYIARPGPTVGTSHAMRMDDGGLKAGDNVKAAHVAGSQLTRIKLADGNTTFWHHEGETRNRDLREPLPSDRPKNFDRRGYRIFS